MRYILFPGIEIEHIHTMPKLYIDSAHLMNLYKVRHNLPIPPKNNAALQEQLRHAYAYIDVCIVTGQWALIFNPAAPLDWVDGSATLQSALEPASVVDSARLQYELEMDTFVYTSEVLDECRRVNPELTLPRLPVLHLRLPGGRYEPALGVLAQIPGFLRDGDVPDYHRGTCMPRAVPVVSARRHVLQSMRFKSKSA
jgi:hypothetical protein